VSRSPRLQQNSKREFDPRVLRRLDQFAAGCSVLAGGFGLWVLTGWTLHRQWMKSILPGQVAVKANTAVCFLLIGIALWILRREDSPIAIAGKRLAKTAAVVASMIGLISFLEFVMGWELGIDQLLFTAGVEDFPGSARVGLMSPLAGLGFFGLGLALLMLGSKSKTTRWWAQVLLVGVSISGMFGILDFVLTPQTTHTYISPVTALVLFLLAFGILFARTGWGLAALVASEGSGGTATRRLLPAATLVPLVIAWLRWEGQGIGLYSDWTGVALMTVSCSVLLSGLTIWTGFTIDSSERERLLSQENVDRLASIVECSNDAIIGKTTEGVITSWNPGAEAIYGYSAEEIIGKSISIVIPPDRQEEFATILEKIRQGQRISHYDTERLRKGGQIVFVSLSVSPLKNKAGRLVGVSTIARDVTERKRAEAALQESEAKFRALSDLVPQFVWMCTPDGLNVYFNQRWVEYTGLSLEESYGRGWNTPFHPNDKQTAWDAWNRAVNTGDAYRVESRLRARDGSYRWFLIRGVPLREVTGNITKWFGTCTDIDDLKRAEEALRRASLYTRSLIEASLDPLVTISRDGKITDVNQATEFVTGISRDRLIGSDFSDYFTDPESARLGYKEVFAQGKVQDYPLAIRHANGRVTDVLYNASVFKNEAGEIEGVFAAARDVTRRKQIEDELRLSRERLALAQRAAHSGTFDWDIQNNINRWSAEVEEVHGIAPGEFGGTFEHWEALVVPQDLATAKKALEESLRTGEFASEWRIRRRNDGEIRWITARAKVLFDDSGKPERMLGLNMDVTERKRAEEEVRRLNEELEQRVIQRTAQLEAANKELEAFTYSVSHDLRAPLRHISGFANLLSEEYGSILAPEAQHHLERIQEGTRRMGVLVDDLLNLGRIGRHEVRLQVTGLNSVANESVADLKPECEGRQVEWKIGLLPFVECDPALMKQVFQNLLSNAVKFTRPRTQAVIEVGQKEEGGTPVVFVRDNGVGFNMKYADKLFGVFQRLHRVEDFEGTGVGLATVQRIVQKHGGRIWAEAELDKGATFFFTLGTSQKTELKSNAATEGDKA